MKAQQNTKSSSGSSGQLYSVPYSMKRKFFLKEVFFWVYHAARLALTITILILISQTNTSAITQSQEFERVQQVLQIWQKDVIIDAIVVSTYNCPENYQRYTAAAWPGTKEGCLCQETLTDYDYIHVLPGQCSLKLIEAGCTTVEPQEEIPFVFWRPGYLVCIKRIQNLNFMTNLTEYLSDGEIQKCAEGTSYQFQSLSKLDCPITAISNTTEYEHILEEIGFSFEREGNYPVVDLRITQYSFCIEYGKQNISPNRFQNYNLQAIEIEHCSEEDPRVIQIDQITEKQLYENNERISDLVAQLPVYPEPTDEYVYKLGMVRYPPWNAVCRNSEEFSTSAAMKNFQFDDATDDAENCMLSSIAFLCVWGLLYSIVSWIRKVSQLKSRSNNHILYLPDSEVEKINPNLLNNTFKIFLCDQIIFLFFLTALAIALLAVIGSQYHKTDLLEVWFRKSRDCMDSSQYFINWVDTGYVQNLQESIRIYLICILSAIIIVCIDILYLIWRTQKGDLAHEALAPPVFEESSKKDSDEQREGKIESDEIQSEKYDDSIAKYQAHSREHRQTFYNPTEQSLANLDNSQKDSNAIDQLQFDPTMMRRRNTKKKKTNKILERFQFIDFE